MKEYGVGDETGHVEMFSTLAAAKAYAKKNKLEYIDIYDNDPESMEYLSIIGDVKVTL